MEYEDNLIQRDLKFFLFIYTFVLFFSLILSNFIKILSIFVIIFYIFYVRSILKEEGEELEVEEPLYFERFFRLKEPLFQFILSTVGLIYFSHLFVGSLRAISQRLGLDPFFFSLFVAPVATELPEKFNSFLWSLRNKYTLAFANITGAMVFQSTFPVSVGIILSNWNLSFKHVLSILIALFSSSLLLFQVYLFKRFFPPLLVFQGLLYFLYVILVWKGMRF